MSICIYEHESYRGFLKDFFHQKQKANKSYSLRAFARDLGLTPQTLSLTLKNKRRMSLESASRITKKLQMPLCEAAYFLDLVIFCDIAEEAAKEIVAQRIKNAQHNYFEKNGTQVFKLHRASE
ncbi:hypothetical protein A11Q_112 [Pseudobdellovibrio exovorus JSS]|uniref:HTH cro/C1-type domain-containing protein n=2 Tax=Pseudobdellovibrio exovorus TaxID=453816 RepID=M4V4R6_9BACT|nr:hypothetical protein A11Q_112 [Pseudobdellovibrio exovorus JSS]